jgi:signal transduction histidine kinase
MNASKPQPLKAEQIHFFEIAQKLVSNHWEQLADDGITVKLNFDNKLEVFADPNRLYQILLNLMLNSRDAMPAGGKITISAYYDNDWFVMNFTDTGLGISQEDAHKIFTPFFTTKASGTGLGLSICDQIAKAHSGHMSFISDENSTTFTLKIPQKLALEE